MEKITFINANGVSIEFGSQFPFLLEKIEGISETGIIDLSTRSYNQDGVTDYDTLSEPRLIKAGFVFNAPTHAEMYTTRRTVEGILNHKLGLGTLVYENDDGKYQISAKVIDGPMMTARKTLRHHAEVAFICPNPYWLSYIENIVKLVGFVGGLSFPLEFPISFASAGDSAIFTGIGDVETPLTIEFRGPASGCKIINDTTGEFVEVTYTLLADEKLIIYTDKTHPSVTFVDAAGLETSAFNKINILSSFFRLQPGAQTLSFTALSGTPDVYLKWYDRYVGV